MTRRGPQFPFVLKALTCEATMSDDSKQRPFQDEEPTKITPNQQRQCVCACNKSLEEKRLSHLIVFLVSSSSRADWSWIKEKKQCQRVT